LALAGSFRVEGGEVDYGASTPGRWNYAKKKQFHAAERLRPDVVAQRNEYLGFMAGVRQEDIVSLDECGCNRHTVPQYGWAPAGTRAVATRGGQRGPNVTVVGAVRQDRVLCHEKFLGALNTERWESFVEHKLCPLLHEGNVVILDNLSVHKSPRALALIEETGAIPLFLPPYHPELNPIEECWALVKHYLRKLIAKGVGDVFECLRRALARIKSSQLRGWFEHAGYRNQPN
jgi:transposase